MYIPLKVYPPAALAFAAAIALIGVSVAFNVGAAIDRADTTVGRIAWATASAASDVLKVLAPLALLASIRRRAWAEAFGVLVVLFITATYSLTSAISFAHGSRDAVTVDRTAAAGTVERTRNAFDAAAAKLAAMPSARLSGEVASERDAILSDPKAGGCLRLDGPYTREHCPTVALLNSELARSQERAG